MEKNQILKHLALLILPAILLWLLIGYVKLDLTISNWEENVRLAHALISTLFQAFHITISMNDVIDKRRIK